MKLTDSKYWQGIKRIIPYRLYDLIISIYYKFRSLKLKGDNKFCPICQKKHSAFISDAVCPNCGSGVRHRSLWLFLERRTDLFKSKDKKLLYFAPHFYIDKKFKKLNNLNYLSADINAKRAMEKIDMTNISYPDNFFDHVISVDVLDDVDDDIKAISELLRVQKVNGWSIHQVPINYTLEATIEDPNVTDPEERFRLFGAYENKRRYAMDYKERLEKLGFKVKIYNVVDFCKEDEIESMNLENYNIFYLEK